VDAAGRIEAIFRNKQAPDRLAVHDVGFDDLLYIRGGDAAVPDTVRINDHRRPMFALIEASGHIRPHSLLESAQGEFLFEEELKLGLARWVAATARMSGFALIAADEEMFLELGHGFNLQDSSQLWDHAEDSSGLGGCALAKLVDSEFQEADNQEERPQQHANPSGKKTDQPGNTRRATRAPLRKEHPSGGHHADPK
jgi:hypothetical protein